MSIDSWTGKKEKIQEEFLYYQCKHYSWMVNIENEFSIDILSIIMKLIMQIFRLTESEHDFNEKIFPMINLFNIQMQFYTSVCVWNAIWRYGSLFSRSILDSKTTTWNRRQNSFDRKINCKYISNINEASSSLWSNPIETTIYNRCYVL